MRLGRIERQSAPEHEPVEGRRACHVEKCLPPEFLRDGLEQGTRSNRPDGGGQVSLEMGTDWSFYSGSFCKHDLGISC